MIAEHDFSFCPKCSGKMELKEANLLVCTNCDLHYYINPKACNTVIITNEKGEVLLVKRKYDPQKGFWDLPGGFVDINESIEESVVREIKEELGISLEHIQYLTSVPDRYEYKGLNYHTICSVFTAKLHTDTQINIGDDVAEVKFVKPKDIDFRKIAFDSIKQLLRSYQTRVVPEA